MKRVLDTNAVLYFLGGRVAEALPEDEYFVSVITEIELLSYPSLDTDAEQKIRSFLSEVSLVGITPEVIDAAVQLRRQQGLKLPDAIVAGTALVLGAELVTNDLKLSRLPGLTCRNLKLRSS